MHSAMTLENLSPDEREKLLYAAKMLSENLRKTEVFRDRSAGITNGDCLRVQEGRRKFLEKMRKNH